MRLKVPNIDGRSIEAKWGFQHDVVDTDTGKIVGYLRLDEGTTGGSPNYKRTPCRMISLFSDKYIGRFETHAECWAFAEGVAVVFNRLISIKDDLSEVDASASELQEPGKRIA